MDEKLVQALQICPAEIRSSVLQLAKKAALCVEEVRLRAGQPASVYAGGREWKLQSQGSCLTVSQQTVAQVVACAAEYSVYHAQEQLKRGFCTIAGGHRLGVCGEAVCEQGQVLTLKNFSSVNLRVAHSVPGAADAIIDLIWKNPESVLLIGPPGSGKTTVLRDTVRQLSDRLRCSVSLVDERWELAAMTNGIAQFEVGCATDVLTGVPKAEAITMLLRSMRPDWIAVDEITDKSDVQAMVASAYCGVRFVATAHAVSLEDLTRRPIYRRLLEQQVFGHIVLIDKSRHLHLERI